MRGLGTKRVLTDIVSLVRHAIQPEPGDDILEPYPEIVQRRYADWLAAREAVDGPLHGCSSAGGSTILLNILE